MPEVRVACAVGLATVVATLALGAASSAADVTPTADPPVTEPTPPPLDTTVTVGTTTAAAAETTSTTTAATSEATPATTAAAQTTPAAVAPGGATLSAAPRPAAGCPAVGAVGLLLPQRPALVLAPYRQLSSASFSYPSDGSVVTAAGLSIATCTDARPTGGTVQVRALSLFGGVVTARTATLSLSGGRSTVSGLEVGGRPVSLAGGKPIRLGNWGFLLAPDTSGSSQAAFEIELVQPRGGLPPGTIVFIPYAKIALAPTATVEQAATTSTVPATTTAEVVTPAAPSPAAAPAVTAPPPHDEGFARPKAPSELEEKSKPGSRPLTVTPPLEAGPYLFPVAGSPVWGDSYGGARPDVSGGWHHGDDIFAPLGTPVVAVAEGTVNRVGWERLGGWRLWVRDRAGDQFYYAHLSAYSPLALHSKHVHRGDVIGFVGNTGDAFTTLPHLHFEVHPRSLLHLEYDGAVNPTSYLSSWGHPEKLHAPLPVHPRLPRSALFLHEAQQNWRELLAARGLDHPARRVSPATAVAAQSAPVALPAVRASAAAPSRSGASSLVWPIAATVFMAAVALAAGLRTRDGVFFPGK